MRPPILVEALIVLLGFSQLISVPNSWWTCPTEARHETKWHRCRIRRWPLKNTSWTMQSYLRYNLNLRYNKNYDWNCTSEQTCTVRRWELGVQTVFPISFAALSPICSVSYMIYFFHKSCLGTNMYQFAIRSHEHSSRPPLLASGMLHQQDEWLPKGWNGAADCLILLRPVPQLGINMDDMDEIDWD